MARAITIASACNSKVNVRMGIPPSFLQDSEGTARSLLPVYHKIEQEFVE